MTRPRLLDLFCGAGGATRGYQQAGFHVTGVDNRPQPNYCGDDFIEADALDILIGDDVLYLLADIDVVHASPPCQRYIRGGLADRDKHPDLLGPVRYLLRDAGRPWVIENVPGAPLRRDLELCGSMFGLEVRRHRWFETSPRLFTLVPPCDHSQPVAGVYGNPHGEAGAWPGMLPSDLPTWSRAMGIDWMNRDELAQAIPPAYTQFIGEQLLEHLRAGVS